MRLATSPVSASSALLFMNNMILSLVKMNGNKVINPLDNEQRLLLKFTMQMKQT